MRAAELGHSRAPLRERPLCVLEDESERRLHASMLTARSAYMSLLSNLTPQCCRGSLRLNSPTVGLLHQDEVECVGLPDLACRV